MRNCCAFSQLQLAGKDAVAAYTALLTAPLVRLGRFGQWLEVTSNLASAVMMNP